MPNLTAQLATAFGALIGTAVLFLIASLIFRDIKTSPRAAIVCGMIIAVLAMVAHGFGEGEGGFESRVKYIPSLESTILYGTSALIITAVIVKNVPAIVVSLALTAGLHWWWHNQAVDHLGRPPNTDPW